MVELQSINVTSRSYKEQLIDIDLQAVAQEITNISPKPLSYAVYTAVLSQSGTDNPLSIDTGLLTIGVTYMIATSFTGDDFSNVGGPEITFDDEGLGTYFIATGTTPANWTNETEFEYNTGAPVVTVLENTIGEIYWTWDSTGFYTWHSARLFTENKSFALISSSTMGAIVTNISVYDTSNTLIVASDSEGYRENFIAYVEIRVYNTK
jgi:hypothetical protein